MQSQYALDLLKIRVLVMALGELPHAGWWKSQFLSPVGLSYLSRLYPRSNFAAAVRSAKRAAEAVHDSSIGVGRVFHLFRLPQAYEQLVESVLRERADELHNEFVTLHSQKDKLLGRLREHGQGGVPEPQGPVRLGTLSDLDRGRWSGLCAATYAAAFQRDIKVFPYVEAQKTI